MEVKLGLDSYIDEAEEILRKDLEESMRVQRKTYDNMTLFTVESGELSKTDFYDHVAEKILKIILDYYGLDIIEKQLYNYRDYIGVEERKMAFDLAKNKILSDDKYILEKEYIKEESIGYMEEYPIIYLDGFVRFRLKNLKDFVEDVIVHSIESLNIERERDNLRSTLKYMAKEGRESYDYIRLIFKEEGFILEKDSGEKINEDYFRNLAKDLGLGKISEEDMLISGLLALGPSKIAVDMNEYLRQDILHTIEDIFVNKIYYCYDENNCIRKVSLRVE